jgi:hypothetical protein
VLHYLTPVKYRWLTLLLASYFFYINIRPVYALLLAGVTTSTYVFTRLMDSTSEDTLKKRYLVLNIVIVLFPLFFFKYFGAINDVIIVLLKNLHIHYALPAIKYFFMVILNKKLIF